MSQLVNQVKVLEQQRTQRSRALPAAGVVHRRSIGSGINWLLVVPIGMSAAVLGNHFVGVYERRGEAGRKCAASLRDGKNRNARIV